eukprot:Nk52_evm76s224 gene=Nk52_evmTU76s224
MSVAFAAGMLLPGRGGAAMGSRKFWSAIEGAFAGAERRAVHTQRAGALCHFHGGHDHEDGHGGGACGRLHSELHVDKSVPMTKEMQAAQKVTVLGMYANLGLGMCKSGIGYLSGSHALMADAAHTVSDLISDFVTLVAVRFSRKRASEQYPYGYGQLETIGSVVVASFLLSSGLGILAMSGNELVNVIFNNPSIIEPIELSSALGVDHHEGHHKLSEEVTSMADFIGREAALGVALASVAVKEGLFRITERVAKKQNSPALHANAWHHRSDAMTSVVAIVGVGGDILGFPVLDPLGGVVVASMILRTGATIFMDNMFELSGGGGNSKLKARIRSMAEDVLKEEPGWTTITRVRVRRMGPHLIVHLDIKCDGEARVEDITTQHQAVREYIQSHVKGVQEVIVEVAKR